MKTVEINGKTVEIPDDFKITVGDTVDLVELGVDFGEFQKAEEEKRMPSPKMMLNLVHHFSHKFNNEVTVEDVREVPLADLVIIVQGIFENMGKFQDMPLEKS